jgi:glycerol transport system ATP-binding protein
LRLIDVSYRSGLEVWLHPMTLSLAESGINVLLGATLAGKTTLLRVMAGLERPASGQLFVGNREVTGVPVRRRNLSMVYQQFINYPSMTVFENIASPLRLARHDEAVIRQRVAALAEKLHLTPYLDRHPAELSGGQQQRTALARALAKDSELVLLDEPLVNLDYKLREELREELKGLFSERRATVVYATTEPREALQLGGHTAVLVEGRLIQYGPTLEVFRHPINLAAARAFSDPPLNEIPASFDASKREMLLADGVRIPVSSIAAALLGDSREVILGIRAHQFSLDPRASTIAISGRVDLAEISGSETYVHLSRQGMSLVAQLQGVHMLPLGELRALHVDPADLYCFDPSGSLVFAPE